jgi:hypothetical protein
MASARLGPKTGAALHLRKIPRSRDQKFTFNRTNDIKCQSQSFANKMPAPLLSQINIRAHFGRGTLIAMLSSNLKCPASMSERGASRSGIIGRTHQIIARLCDGQACGGFMGFSFLAVSTSLFLDADKFISVVNRTLFPS